MATGARCASCPRLDPWHEGPLADGSCALVVPEVRDRESLAL